jgi:hypothetical protein
VALFRSALTLAFFFLLRVSEVRALGVDHVSLSHNFIIVFIQASNTDQFGLGAVVEVYRSNDSMFLFQSLQYHLTACSVISRVSYLSHLDTKPLTQYQFSAMLKKSLTFFEH